MLEDFVDQIWLSNAFAGVCLWFFFHCRLYDLKKKKRKKERKHLEITFLGTLARRNFVAWVFLRKDLYTLLQMPKNFQQL